MEAPTKSWQSTKEFCNKRSAHDSFEIHSRASQERERPLGSVGELPNREKMRREHEPGRLTGSVERTGPTSAYPEAHPSGIESPEGQKGEQLLEPTRSIADLQKEVEAANRRSEEASRRVDLLAGEKAEIEAEMD